MYSPFVIRFTPVARKRWDIRIGGHKKGHIISERGSFIAVVTRNVGPHALTGICNFVADLTRNAELAKCPARVEP
jgi:hypothetical protein